MYRRLMTFGLAALVAAMAVACPVPASAAIPCEAQPELEPTTPVAARVRDGALTVEEMLAGPDGATMATPIATESASPVASAVGMAQAPTENLVRCLLYNDFAAFGTLLTPEYRAEHIGVGTADEVIPAMGEVASIRLLGLGGTTATVDGGFQTMVELLVDGERFIIASLEFAVVDDLPYLASSAIIDASDVTASATITLQDNAVEPVTLEINASETTMLVVDHAGEVPVGYVLEGPGGETLSEGRVDPDSFAGPPDDSVMVLHDLQPGDYRLVFTPRGNPGAGGGETTITVAP